MVGPTEVGLNLPSSSAVAIKHVKGLVLDLIAVNNCHELVLSCKEHLTSLTQIAFCVATNRMPVWYKSNGEVMTDEEENNTAR
jgi:hypothetical protein